ncbi:MAG TPA: haloacid dehalogenase-like hydrolase [Tahibacter sp.]|uniref:haloacid dehalogenase-like hydrolase n=1 Tax=Tahibacter sp. TaxID=2056211 RepID=UPI002CB69BF6|nr:haloacid dehalogenase-like hydrolase [Tahibacter sp.]HSX58799.1 haloacid dehalogenase-like hydrolase [Tahibacter sp.]
MTATIVFDFDGVLLRGDSFAGYLRWRTRARRRRVLAALPMLPLLPLMRHPRTLPWAARAFTRALTVGLDRRRFEAEIDAFCAIWLAGEGRVNAPLVERLRAHVAAGDRVFVVSGTAQYLLDGLLRELGVTGVTAVGSTIEFGRAGLYARRHTFGATKIAVLAEFGVIAPWAVSYSDSYADLPILAAAQRAVLVEPSAAHERLLRDALGDRIELIARAPA